MNSPAGSWSSNHYTSIDNFLAIKPIVIIATIIFNMESTHKFSNYCKDIRLSKTNVMLVDVNRKHLLDYKLPISIKLHLTLNATVLQFISYTICIQI